MPTIELFCASCAGITRYEQPPCADGHGVDCPEWACVRCGDAILLGPIPMAERQPAVPVAR